MPTLLKVLAILGVLIFIFSLVFLAKRKSSKAKQEQIQRKDALLQSLKDEYGIETDPESARSAKNDISEAGIPAIPLSNTENAKGIRQPTLDYDMPLYEEPVIPDGIKLEDFFVR